MADGYLGKCKECAKADVRMNRSVKIDHYREFDRMRANLPHRVAGRLEYARSEAGKASHSRALAWSMAKWPEKAKARNALSNAVRDGKIAREACRKCGDQKAEAHHEDYSKPLEVVWLCNKHHHDRHRELKAEGTKELKEES